MPSDQTIIPPARRERRMAIKNLVPSLPERGKIKIGIKGREITSRNNTTFQPPQKLDHFLVTTLERGQDSNFMLDTAFHAQHGAAPTAIPIRLLYDDPALNFPTRYAAYVGRALWCSGDGEVAVRMSEQPGQPASQPREVQCPCFRQQPGYQGRDKCKMNGSLSVLIEGAGGLGGVWKFRTTGYNSIVGIMSSMAFLRSVSGGVLAGLPLKLTVKPKQAQTPTDGSPVTIYVVGIEFDGDLPQLQNAAHDVALDRARMQVSIANIEEEARRTLMIEGPGNAALPGDDANDVIDEFYPEQAIAAQAPQQPTGTKLEQFEQKHAPASGVYDPETGEVAHDNPPPLNDAAWIAAGDAVCEKGLEEFRGWWNSLGKPLITRMGGQKGALFIKWKIRAIAADERGGPAPEDEARPFASAGTGPSGGDGSNGGNGTKVGAGPRVPTASHSELQGSPYSASTPPEAAIAAPPLPGAPAASVPPAGSLEIPPVYGRNGELLWPTWTNGLFVPKLKQQQTVDQLAALIHANALHMEAAEAALGVDWPDAAISAAWNRVGR